jgi:hypothetical protein
MTNFDYYKFRIENVTKKINEEIAFYENDSRFKDLPIALYLTYLKSRVGMDKIEYPSITHYDTSGHKHEIKKMNIDEYVKDMDINTFSRPWMKLREIHRIMKIKEFVDTLEYHKKTKESKIMKNRDYLKNELCLGLKSKKFGKKKSVIDYHQESMLIVSISCIDYNKKTLLYEIDWDN